MPKNFRTFGKQYVRLKISEKIIVNFYLNYLYFGFCRSGYFSANFRSGFEISKSERPQTEFIIEISEL